MSTVCWCPIPNTSAPPMQGSLSENGNIWSSVTVLLTAGGSARAGVAHITIAAHATAWINFIVSLVFVCRIKVLFSLLVARTWFLSELHLRINPDADDEHQPQADSCVGRRLKELSVF